MANKLKDTVEYFPFFVKEGRTLYVLKKKYGLIGIGFFTQLLRWLSQTPGHVFPFREDFDKEMLQDYTGLTESDIVSMLNDMARTGKIDADIWEKYRVIISKDFIETISEAYRRRRVEVPDFEELKKDICLQYKELSEDTNNTETICQQYDDNMQTLCKQYDDMPRVNEMKRNEMKENKTIADSAACAAVVESNPLYSAIKKRFEKEQLNERFTNYGKEGKAIHELIKKACARAPDGASEAEVSKFIFGLIELFADMRQTDKFYGKQPFLPSVLNSTGIFDRVLNEAQQRWEVTQGIPGGEAIPF